MISSFKSFLESFNCFYRWCSCFPGLKLVEDCHAPGQRSNCTSCPAGQYTDKINYSPNCRTCKRCKSRVTLPFFWISFISFICQCCVVLVMVCFVHFFFLFTFHNIRAWCRGIAMWETPEHYLSLWGWLLQIWHWLRNIRVSQMQTLRTSWKGNPDM